ncbi:hypothetical protein [Roseibium album]|uniref:hypothetical protein n=1 Tax=Roseibium album TaxID=311410 RepID=UPI002493B6F1|nr:hypothetical protein [Roseibium album]
MKTSDDTFRVQTVKALAPEALRSTSSETSGTKQISREMLHEKISTAIKGFSAAEIANIRSVQIIALM